MKQKLSRRDFLKLAGAGVAGLALAACGIDPTQIPAATSTSTNTPTATLSPTPEPSSTPTPSPTPEPNLRTLANSLNFTVAAQVVWYKLKDPVYTQTALMVINKLISDGEFSPEGVFHKTNWRKILDNWNEVQASLDAGIVPYEKDLDFVASDALIRFAQKNGTKVHAQHLFSPAIMPDDFLDGQYSNDEILKLVRYAVQSRVLRYKGLVNSWVGYNEYVEWKLYGNGRKEFFWINAFGESLIENIFAWAKQADPDAKLVFNSNYILEPEFEPGVNAEFFRTLNRLKSKNVPIDVIGVQNHFWVYDPPNKESAIEVINACKSLGFTVMATETTVSQSNLYPFWLERPKVKIVENTLSAHTQIYADIFSAFIETNSAFGMFGFSDAVGPFDKDNANMPDAQALIFDDKYQPKPAYFAMMELLKQQATG
jgi:GH35 family endo-1,4-beta-xylanase